MRRTDPAVRWLALAPVVAALACSTNGVVDANGVLQLSSTPIDFGNQPVLTPLAKQIPVANVGRGPLTVSEPVLMDVQPAGSNAFTVQVQADGIPGKFLGDTKGQLQITFSAPAEGPYSATLVFKSDDKSRPVVSIPLTGNATTVAVASVTPTCLDFGTVCEGHSAIQSVTVTSGGTAPLLITQLQLAGGSSAAFGPVGSWSTTPPVQLTAAAAGQPNDSAIVNVDFTPTTATVDSNLNATGTLDIGTNDPRQQNVSVCLKGAMQNAPTANAGTNQMVAPGTTVTLDGSGSMTSGSGALTYQWTLDSAPQGSMCSITNPTSAMPTLCIDQPGQYVVSLVVGNGVCTASAPSTVTITGILSNDLKVELDWDNGIVDLDLHLTPMGEALYGPEDCWWSNPNVTGGPAGPGTAPWYNGMCHDFGDVLEGYGPETIDVQTPADGNYVATVVYANANGATNKTVNATVNFYLYGFLVGTVTKQLNMPGTFPSDMGETWQAATVTWPTGALAE